MPTRLPDMIPRSMKVVAFKTHNKTTRCDMTGAEVLERIASQKDMEHRETRNQKKKRLEDARILDEIEEGVQDTIVALSQD
jgi:hypothetical protein